MAHWDVWWAHFEEETTWLEKVELRMADLRPLAGSVTIIKSQKEDNEVNFFHSVGIIFQLFFCIEIESRGG